MPTIQNPEDTKRPDVGGKVWWHKKPVQYGHGTNPIYVAVLAKGEVSDAILKPDARAFCGVAVQQSTVDDVGILLGVPPQAAPN